MESEIFSCCLVFLPLLKETHPQFMAYKLYTMCINLHVFCSLHLQKESFVELVETIGRKTGGLSVFPFTSPVRGKPDDPLAKIMVSA